MLVIDPGHGGIDPGAIGNGIIEKDYVLEVSLYQYNRFKELGVPVKLTRSTDKTLTPNERTSIVRNSGADHCISNHVNASGGTGDGAEVIKSINNNTKLPDLIATNLAASGQNVRRIFSRKGSNGQDYYFMQRETGNVQTLIVEYGFLDSKGDDVDQLISKKILYAEAVVKAYCLYIGHPYTSGGKVDDIKDAVSNVLPDGVFKYSDDYHPDIKTIQMYLNYFVNEDLELDGYFGKSTLYAMKSFQRLRGINDDGVYGPDTKRELLEYYAEVVAKKKPENANVYRVQTAIYTDYGNAKEGLYKIRDLGIKAEILKVEK